MLDWLKAAWASWRVRVTMVGGAIVVATAYGTCSYDPQEVSEAEVAPQVEPETEQVSETTTETTTEVTAGTTTETTTETTATE
tara:strand:+ start:167 stop:415 length:249 start_codon:yes stop_codon:yes gene_type:complete